MKTCETILQANKMPAVSANDDARIAFLRDDAALIRANGKLVNGQKCVADVRTRYAK